MRYSHDHNALTRIIKEASVCFCRDGVGATGQPPLMKALNLTHGGFYAHLKSKDEGVLGRSVESAELATRIMGGYVNV